MAINVTGNIANIAVNTTSNVVTVSSSPVNVQLSATSVVSNTSVRQAITVSNLSGYGNLTYDSSNTSNGVIQYTGTANSDITTVITDNPSAVRPALSASSPITYSSVTGVIGLEQTLDDLTLKKYQETVVSHGNDGGNISVNLNNGTVHKFTVTSDITKIDLNNISTGGSATLILTQDGVGNNVLDTTTHPLEWVNWDFVNDFKSLDLTAGNYSILNVLWDGSKYYASLVVDSEISPTSLTVSGNIVGGNIDSQGVITSTGNITSSANVNSASFTTTANATVGANLNVLGNLEVTGNINYREVEDLLVRDQTITLNFGNASANDVQIISDRSGSGLANTDIKWNETTDKWTFTNDGSTYYPIPTSTSDLAEGTNLYYTNARTDARIGAYTGALTPSTITASGNITALNANIDTSVNIGENSGANATLTLHANTSTTVYPNVELYAPGMARMASQPTAYATRLSPGGLSVNGLGDNNVTTSSNNFTVDLTELDFFAGNITGTDPIQVRVENTSDLTGNPSTDYDRGRLRINKQWSGSIATNMTDLLTYEDFQRASSFNVGGNLTLSGGAHLFGNSTITGAGAIDMTGDISSTTRIFTDAGANIEAAGYLQSDTGVVTGGTITGNNLVANANVNAQIMIASGNITGANINANYYHGDGSNLTGIAGDISSVTAGAGLTGGGTSGAVTLNVGAGTGITVNADDIAVDMSAFSTSDLAEGTNLYYTDARSRAALSTTTASASGGGSLAYDSGTGVFTFAPADSVTTATNATQVAITDDTSTDAAHYVTLSPAASGNQALEVSSSKLSFNPSSGVLQTDHISSASAQPLQLKGQTDGIKLDKTIATVESRIFDTDTTGYSLVDADLGTANVTGVDTPQILCVLSFTQGSTTATASPLIALYGSYIGIEDVGGGFAVPNSFVTGDASLEGALTTTGTTIGGGSWAGLANLSGWRIFATPPISSSTYFTGITGHITGISGNSVTLSEAALQTGATSVVLIPGAFSSTQNFGLAITGDNSQTGIPFDYALSIFNQYDLPETLSNVTVDRISYGTDSTINLANVVMRHIADVETGPDSAIKVPRSMLIGANTTPDLLSIGTNEAFAATSTLGITIEQDGVTDFGPLETTPQMKLMLNNYKTNSLASFTEYPKWTQFLGQSGNATVDMPYIGAPNLNFKLIGGTKPTKTATTGGDIVGRITYNALTGTGATGSDQFNPPASITTMVGGTGDLTAMANLDMYFQSTSATAYRNGPYVGSGQGSVASGSIPQTFLASKSGTTVLAANQAGTISLRPARDYADSGNASSYVDNRYADNLHEYHTFVDVGYENTAGRTGAKLTIQSKSGQTNGATPSGSDFNYDSVGEAVLRLKTHNSDSTTKSQWDIEANQASGNLSIINSLNEGSPTTVMHFDGARVFVDEVLRLQNLTTTEINAISGPQAGDVVYNTSLNLVCFFNGTVWQRIDGVSAMGT